jgi:RNA polymerase sigma factor (sigma-70 family)
MSNYDYRTILQFIGDKDPMGLELLYERYGKPLHKYALDRWKIDEEDAWELVYKTLETLVLKLPSYEFVSQARFDGFLFQVFINFLREKHRKDRTRELPRLEFFDLEEEFTLPGYVQEALTKQAFLEYYTAEKAESPVLSKFKTALEQLSEPDQEILLLRAQNYSYDEIAVLLGIENKQLKVRYHRAKERLIKLLNEITI